VTEPISARILNDSSLVFDELVRMHYGHLKTTDYIRRLRAFGRTRSIGIMDRSPVTSFM
jgi:hypothetical protein